MYVCIYIYIYIYTRTESYLLRCRLLKTSGRFPVAFPAIAVGMTAPRQADHVTRARKGIVHYIVL